MNIIQCRSVNCNVLNSWRNIQLKHFSQLKFTVQIKFIAHLFVFEKFEIIINLQDKGNICLNACLFSVSHSLFSWNFLLLFRFSSLLSIKFLSQTWGKLLCSIFWPNLKFYWFTTFLNLKLLSNLSSWKFYLSSELVHTCLTLYLPFNRPWTKCVCFINFIGAMTSKNDTRRGIQWREEAEQKLLKSSFENFIAFWCRAT